MSTNEHGTKKQTVMVATALTAILLWASAFPGTRFVLLHYSPGAVMVLRFVTASLTFIIIGLFKKIRLPKLKDLPLCIASGLSGVFLYSFLFTTGAVTVSAGVSSFIIASSPVFTMIFVRLILKEKVKILSWVGIWVSFIGLAAVTLFQSEEFAFNFGVVLVLGAAICSGIYSLIIRQLTKTYTALEATTYTIIIGAIGTLFFLPDVIRELPTSTVDVNLVIVFLGVFPAGMAYLSWSYAMSKARDVSHVVVFTYLIPFISSVLGYFWLGETLTIFALIGGVVIIAGMVITNYFGRE